MLVKNDQYNLVEGSMCSGQARKSLPTKQCVARACETLGQMLQFYHKDLSFSVCIYDVFVGTCCCFSDFFVFLFIMWRIRQCLCWFLRPIVIYPNKKDMGPGLKWTQKRAQHRFPPCCPAGGCWVVLACMSCLDTDWKFQLHQDKLLLKRKKKSELAILDQIRIFWLKIPALLWF